LRVRFNQTYNVLELSSSLWKAAGVVVYNRDPPFAVRKSLKVRKFPLSARDEGWEFMSGAPERSEISVVASEGGPVMPDGSQTDRKGVRFDDSVSSRLNFLSEVVRSLPAGVTVQDEQGNFVLVNAAAAAQFNVPARDIVGTASGAPFRSRALNDRRHLARGVLQSGKTRKSKNSSARIMRQRSISPRMSPS
jgi:PAS domain-containing protein